MPDAVSPPEELPPPSAELVLIRVMVEAFLVSADLPKGKRAFGAVRVASEILATEETVAALFPVRPRSQQAAQARARRQAIAMFREWTPLFAARLPKP